MIINSKFKDYYDSMQKHGVDKRIVYNRNQILLTESSLVKYPKLKAFLTENKNPPGCGLLFLCGKIHPFYCKSKFLEDEYYFSLEESLKFFPYLKDEVRDYFSLSKKNSDEMLLETNSPLIIIKRECTYIEKQHISYFGIINPRLKNPHFEKKFPKHQIYQEIQSYISGVLGSQKKETIVISDEVLAAKKGFDKWSFRKKVR